MTFEEYKQALEDNTGFTAERGRDLDRDKIYISDKNEWPSQSLVVLNLSHNCVQRIIGSVLKDYSFSDIAFLFNVTKSFLDNQRKLNPTYELVLQVFTYDRIILAVKDSGCKTYEWFIGYESDFKDNPGYQYMFNDKELADLTDGGKDKFLAKRLNALKEKI